MSQTRSDRRSVLRGASPENTTTLKVPAECLVHVRMALANLLNHATTIGAERWDEAVEADGFGKPRERDAGLRMLVETELGLINPLASLYQQAQEVGDGLGPDDFVELTGNPVILGSACEELLRSVLPGTQMVLAKYPMNAERAKKIAELKEPRDWALEKVSDLRAQRDEWSS